MHCTIGQSMECTLWGGTSYGVFYWECVLPKRFCHTTDHQHIENYPELQSEIDFSHIPLLFSKFSLNNGFIQR